MAIAPHVLFLALHSLCPFRCLTSSLIRSPSTHGVSSHKEPFLSAFLSCGNPSVMRQPKALGHVLFKVCSRCKCESLQRDNYRGEIGHANKEFFDWRR